MERVGNSRAKYDLFDHLFVLDKSEDSDLTLALRAHQGVHLIDFLNQPGPILSVFFGWPFRFKDARYPFILVLFLPFPPRNVTIIPLIPHHLLSLARYMGAHGSQLLQSVKHLLLFAVLGFIDDLGLFGYRGHSLLRERGPDDVTG
jgi:hypothetical protein